MRKKKGVSFGTVLMVFLSIAVMLGSAWVLQRMGGDELKQFDPGKLISAMNGSLAATDAPVNTPLPQSTIKTTLVTLAPTQQPNAPSVTAEPVYHTVTLTLGGQLAFRSDVSDSVYDAGTGNMDYVPVVQEIAHQVYSDLNICTLPHILTEELQYADVTTTHKVADAVKALGMDWVLLNHGNVLDKGEAGLGDTVSLLEEKGIGFAGVRDTDVDGRLRFFTVNDVNIALFGYVCQTSTKTSEAAATSESLVPYDAARAAQDIAAARMQGADAVLVSVWWGNTDQTEITDYQRDVARELCQAGADVILGSGTDAVLPVEWVDAVQPNGQVRRAICAYSLGLLLGESRDTRSQVCSALLHLRLSVSSQDGSIRFDSISYTPTYTWKQEVGGKVQFRVLPNLGSFPAEMSQRQQEIMGRALTLIDQVMSSGPAVKRGQ